MPYRLADVLAIAAVLAGTARASADIPSMVDVELILAVDVSWSMDIEEQDLQREGYVTAISDPEFIGAIRKGDWQRIAVTYVEWAGVGLERIVVPWAVIEDEASARAFAAQLRAAPISRMRRTSISSALINTAQLFDNGIDGMRRVIDISGDGPNNAGIGVTAARDEVLGQGIIINGLPIMIKQGNPGGYFQLDNLDVYYEDCVIGGFGSFMITVNDPARFAEAIRRKLILEIAGVQPELIPAEYRAPGSPPRIDCEIGEKEWRRWQRSDW